MRHLISNGVRGLLLISCLAIGSTACAIDIVHGDTVVQREEKRLAVSGQPELNLRTFDGAIQVKSWDEKDVRVEIERRGPDSKTASELVVTVTQEGNRVVVEAKNPHANAPGIHFGSWAAGSVSLVVTTPRNMTLEARTGDGSIRVEGVDGTISLHTGDGAIRVSRVNGQVNARTGDGSIHIDEATGRVEANTGDGAIDLTGRLEALNVKTGDGSIRVGVEQGSTLVTDWHITTGDGAIDVRLPATLDAEIDAHANDGRVRADGLSGVTEEGRNGRTLKGRLGNGGRVLRIRTGDGGIAIRT
jgi:DUF4097 and DUF4098 domain-containing protein YvlB